MNKHTPRPWKFEAKPGSNIYISARVDIGKEDMSKGRLQPIYEVSLRPQLRVGEDGIVYAVLSYDNRIQFPSVDFREMQKANACLIAAAPDLLEALRPFANFACDDWQTHGCYNCIAKQAIAKAEGK